MTLDKLKVAARQHEQRDDWRAAIELYRQAIREAEAGSEGADPQLYNRIGDLEHKTGNDQAAADAWEQGATRYAEQGFFNNAIALCGKILRLDPTRIRTYLELARYQARKRVIFDAGVNLRAFQQRMDASGRGDAARVALEHVATEFASWAPMQDLVDELLGRAREESPVAPTAREGDSSRGLVFLDTAPLTLERSGDVAGDADSSKTIDVAAGLELDQVADDALVIGLEPSVSTTDVDIDAVEVQGLVDSAVEDTGGGSSPVAGLIDVERTADEVGYTAPLDGLDATVTLDSSAIDLGSGISGLESTSLDSPADTPAEAATENADAEGGSKLVFLEVPDGEPVPLPEVDRDDPLGARVMAQALLEQGDRDGGIAELERALTMYADREEWVHALQVASELIEAEPSAIHRYQARVEMAARMQDSSRLCDAYTQLGDALLREGSNEKAIAVFRRVLELDERNEHARAALRAMAPDRVVPEGDDGFIDFGAMVNDDVGPRSTRMRTETTTISPDEDETFKEALTEFKRALDQNLGIEEHQAHYDLGIAFREMGLMDEAISEFQKALRSPESRMRASEALGQLFFEQGKPGVAEAVLRGVERGPEGDADKIAVLYWLGRSLEAQGRPGEAQSCYERVLAVDVTFHDAAGRLTQLGSEREP